MEIRKGPYSGPQAVEKFSTAFFSYQNSRMGVMDMDLELYQMASAFTDS
jgi:hypothetical protein